MPLKMQSHTVSRSRACQGTLGCRGRRRGTVMLEFTLVFLVFSVVLLTLLEMARGMWTYVTIANAARQAGAYCMVRGTHNPATLADVQTVVDRWCMGFDASEVSALLARSRAAEARGRARLEAGTIEILQTLSPADRAALAPTILARRGRGLGRGGRGGGRRAISGGGENSAPEAPSAP